MTPTRSRYWSVDATRRRSTHTTSTTEASRNVSVRRLGGSVRSISSGPTASGSTEFQGLCPAAIWAV